MYWTANTCRRLLLPHAGLRRTQLLAAAMRIDGGCLAHSCSTTSHRLASGTAPNRRCGVVPAASSGCLASALQWLLRSMHMRTNFPHPPSSPLPDCPRLWAGGRGRRHPRRRQRQGARQERRGHQRRAAAAAHPRGCDSCGPQALRGLHAAAQAELRRDGDQSGHASPGGPP